MKISSRRRGWGSALVAFAACAAFSVPPAEARSHHSEGWAREHFAAAERTREALNGRSPADRTRRDYQRVLNAYRSVYLGAPSSAKADPSVVAVAETLVEMGRHFDDDRILDEAIEQYRFLLREYPGSRYRTDGMFTIGEIYKDDLNDAEAARKTFQDFLRHYPHNHLAADARQAIAEIDRRAADQKADQKRSADKNQPAANAENQASRTSAPKSLDSSIASEVEAARLTSGKNKLAETRSAGLPRVTGIRHWSTPDYTRVAIDVEGGVKFSSRRIASPSRIFFDLHDTRLASTLVGKSFDVQDGFLKKVRIAQFAPGRTRVVLDVDNLSEYDAFLLPNPYRLIIDIHGKKSAVKPPRLGERTPLEANGALSASDADTEAASSDSGAAQGRSDSAESDSEQTPRIATQSATITEENHSALPTLSVVAKNTQPAIVKKIVDNDDDDHGSSARMNRSDSATSRNLRNTLAGRRKPSTHSLSSSNASSASDPDIREARPTASGDRSLIRALGLKIGKIVIDPGHGGHDTGTIGPDGLEEKDLVLEVSRRLGKLLETRLGAEVVYTRKDDTFIPLETRTAIANQARADLFVSIHANSSHDAAARGVETYYLNFTSSPEALEVAARENAVSEQSIYELQDLVKKIALKEKIEESREFAWDVQQSLHSGLAAKSPAIRDRGIKKAPFIVLIGANMPSILAEISFVSNPTDERRLATGEYRERIAESLYRGIAKYVNGLSGVKVASKMDKGAGQ